MLVMVGQDMFAHKLCALLDRPAITNRDIFDCWFFMNRKTALNQSIVETRMEMPLTDYVQKCIESLEKRGGKGLLNGIGELVNQERKNFVRTQLHRETINLLKFYRQYPIVAPLGKIEWIEKNNPEWENFNEPSRMPGGDPEPSSGEHGPPAADSVNCLTNPQIRE